MEMPGICFWLAWYHALMIIRRIVVSIINFVLRALFLFSLLLALSSSEIPFRSEIEKIRRFTRNDEFEFVGWTLGALGVKLEQFSLGATADLPDEQRSAIVLLYLDQLKQAQDLEVQIRELLSNPTTSSDDQQSTVLQTELAQLRDQIDSIQPYVESVIQDQASQILVDNRLAVGGAPFPPVAFKFTQLPLTLIVSPRDVIRQDANIPLVATLSLSQEIELEDEVAADLDVSTLVTNIGGVGTYPTMVLESSSLAWVFDTVIHEWTHNYLFLRPLGWYQTTSAALRTMNETTANLMGGALGREVLLRYYPDLVPPEPQNPPPTPPSEPPAFDFNAEMHETRVKADELLVQGKVDEAERYMEERRQFFWDHGYRIRKLNQAYFAFHGAYADQPKGPAGADPVGEAVREFWDAIDSPADFLRQISMMNDFADLQAALQRTVTTP